MKKQINIGLIGVGRLGSMYAEFLSYRVPRANLYAVADLIPERARSIAEKYKVRKWYDNHHDLSADPQVDAVVCTATTVNHKAIILDAIVSGKPTFSEKPLTLTLSDARDIESAISRSGVFFQQGFQRRFDKGFCAAKQKIDEGVIGVPVIFRGSSRDPYLPSIDYLRPENSGGQIIDMAIHDIDIARWYMGEFKTVYAVGGVLAYPQVKEVNDTDNVVMVFTFDSGSLGEIDISRNGIYGYDIRAEVQGTKGALQAGYLRETPILVLTEQGVLHDTVPYFPERFGEAYVSQLNNFLDNLGEQKEPLVKISDGIAALQIAAAATHSLNTNSIVNIADF
ncbi:Gfo/Idh/MocA family oxidoreductase [bacterium]|nr:Gfo/Idh/MocA family oxidoreductase [bacterium]